MNLITFECSECGLIYKMLIKKDGSLLFSCMDKLHSKEQLFINCTFTCIHCKGTSKIRLKQFIRGK